MATATAYDVALEALVGGFTSVELSAARVLMLHVRLKGISEACGLDYETSARLVLDAVNAFSPRAVLVPAFTYSFARTGVFHRLYSRAETGRFSEEVRACCARFRTLDPLFSVLDTTSWLAGQQGLNTDGAFEPGCLWERLLEEDCTIVNVDIESFVATQVHYLERLHDVPYREHLFKPGVVYEDDTSFRQVSYDFHARDLKQNRLLDWPRIEDELKTRGCLRQAWANGVKLSVVGAKDFHQTLGARVEADPYFLLQPAAPAG